MNRVRPWGSSHTTATSPENFSRAAAVWSAVYAFLWSASGNATSSAAPRIFRWATGIVLFSLGPTSGLRMMRKLRKLIHAEFYLRANPDVAAARMDPLKHYVKYGAAEGRQPHPLFDPAHYLASCPAARNAGNPLLHFLEQA